MTIISPKGNRKLPAYIHNDDLRIKEHIETCPLCGSLRRCGGLHYVYEFCCGSKLDRQTNRMVDIGLLCMFKQANAIKALEEMEIPTKEPYEPPTMTQIESVDVITLRSEGLVG